MPKVKYVKDIKEGEQVRDLFLVSGKALLSSNAGKPYMSLSLRDRTGQIECRVWDRADEISRRFVRDDIVEASGSAIQYQGRIQLKVHDVRKAEEAGADLSEFLPVTKKGIDPLWKRLQELAAGVGDADLREPARHVRPSARRARTGARAG